MNAYGNKALKKEEASFLQHDYCSLYMCVLAYIW